MPPALCRHGSARAADPAATPALSGGSSEAADSAVDVDGLAGDERCIGTEQECHQCADVGANIADAFHRNAPHRLPVLLGRERLPDLHAVGLRERTDYVDADVVATPLQGGDLRQAADTLLGGGISAPLGLPTGTRPRTE